MHQDMKQHVHKGNKDKFERVCALIMIGDLQMMVYGKNVEKILFRRLFDSPCELQIQTVHSYAPVYMSLT